jgi:uncharacterized protein involved in cysteine biosynthesis
MNEHMQIIMWVVGTALVTVGLFITITIFILSSFSKDLERKVESSMCTKIHEMLDKKLSELSTDAKETVKNMIQLTLAIENIRGMLQAQIDTESGRWDRSEACKKG